MSTFTLKDNHHENPYFEVVNNFLKKQLVIKGNIHALSRLDLGVSWSLSKLVFHHPETNKIVFYDEHYIIDSENKSEKTKYLNNYLVLSLIAQAYENYETFLKDLFRKYISLNIKSSELVKQTLNKVPKNPGDVLVIIKSISPTVALILGDRYYNWFKLIEKIRHNIVHNDQLVSPQFLKDHKGEILNEYFSFVQEKESNNFRIQINDLGAHALLRQFDDAGFSIFFSLSKDEKYNIQFQRNDSE